jgi:hypothetical protein
MRCMSRRKEWSDSENFRLVQGVIERLAHPSSALPRIAQYRARIGRRTSLLSVFMEGCVDCTSQPIVGEFVFVVIQ